MPDKHVQLPSSSDEAEENRNRGDPKNQKHENTALASSGLRAQGALPAHEYKGEQVQDPVREYIETTKEILADANSNFTLEARNAGKAFIRKWEEWKKEADKHYTWMSMPTIVALLLFPVYIIWVIKWNRRCDSLYKELIDAQDRFNSLAASRR